MITLKISSDILPPWTTRLTVEIEIQACAFFLPEPTPGEIEILKRADDGDIAEKLEALALLVRIHRRHGVDQRIEFTDPLEGFSFSGARKFREGALEEFVEMVSQDVAVRKERMEQDGRQNERRIIREDLQATSQETNRG